MPARLTLHGIKIYIEYKKGETKPDKNLPESVGWPMRADYGYIEDTISNECGEELDVYIGPNRASQEVFMCSLMNPEDHDSFMEYKVLLGWDSAKEAEEFARDQYYSDMVGPIIGMSLDDLKDWIDSMRPKAAKDTESEDDQPKLTLNIDRGDRTPLYD